ncbi:MAG: pirin family protein [Crocinitomicaceae bacterium]|nr:pirin family protein [Crocinitomicaceae bacterium]
MNNTNNDNPIKRVKPLGFQWETADPFLFCVHHEDHYPKGNDEMGPGDSMAGRHLGQDFILKDGYRMYHGATIPGFPGHPHRGFETITVVRKGLVDHADSQGAAGRYGNGDVQWMTAGKGLQHSEMFPLVNKDTDNPLELFQIWLNLPKKSKMVEPHFKMLWNETIPSVEHRDVEGLLTTIEVIAGQMDDKNAPAPPPDSWASEQENHVGVFNIQIEAGGTFTLPATAEGMNRTIYFYEGIDLKMAGTNIPEYHGVEVHPDVDIHIENLDAYQAKLLVLQGRPIDEPVVQHGPFVMNTREEIQEAFEDYNQTQFGGWPWEQPGPVHDRSRGRFALHADGTEEIKS